ncbi:Spiroplasmavirus-related protein [Spiroplasma kunkelii CR2-3x]|uniref:Spiroplasmavirus-related protein n=1 Tax=Spiroplasma kunkelii CR2-3x TaxID=273035 RepID=A0A0K2JGP6_SPIKU|nr:DUF3688 family protein [Spiroplasma kunkelii]ALA97618.1 Spiroplasmavirus-related protein [Spiroplasma kunkelii CR2-3x]
MRKRLLYIFIIFYLIFGWIFLFCSVTAVNYISNVCKVETRNNDSFSDLTYAKANEYDFQSTLMLRQDYFMQGLDPSNYAFSFGVETPFIPNVSADKNDSNYWFNKIKNVAWSYLLSWNSQDISKGSLGRLIIDYKTPNKLLDIFIYKNNIKYEFTFNWEIIEYLFMPIIANQSYKHFDMNYLVLNFNYKELINMDILKKSNSNYFVDNVKQDFYSLDNLFLILDYFYSNVLRVIFDISNFRECIYFTSDNGNLGFVFFVKNGFLLYPKSMVFNILRFPDTDIYYLKPQVQLYNAYTINSTNDYFSYYSNWDYKTDILPSNNDKWTQSIKLLDMTDRTKYQGFNVIRFNTTRLTEDRSISINGFNFSLYNATDWSGELNDGKIWQLPYKKGAWYRLDIHIENAAIWIVNNLPGMKEIYKFVNGIVHVFSNVSELFNNIGNLFAFDITFKIMLSSILVLAMVNGLLRYF